MTAQSTESSPRSRRALLAGALGGLAAWAASTAARVSPVEAAAGDPIRMGRTNLSGGTSTTVQTDSSQPTFRAVQLGGGNALRGEATNGRGVVGIGGSNGTGLWGYSPNHVAIRGTTKSGNAIEAYSTSGAAIYANSDGWAGYFQGRVGVAGYEDMFLMSDPPAPPTLRARLFVRDNGSGKMQLSVRFPTGAVQVIATEP